MKKSVTILVILVLTFSLFACAAKDKETFDVFFNTNGGSLIDYQTVESGDKINPVADPFRREYIFGGWYLDNNTFSESAEGILSAPIGKTFTVYAKWIPIFGNVDNPKVTITLYDDRQITLELAPSIAPITVANFLSLVEEGYYTDTVFHRIIAGFMAQAGHLTITDGSLEEKVTKERIKGEFSANGVANQIRHTQGVISMARTNEVDSASTQFFICIADSFYLDGDYAAFGKVADAESLAVAVSLGEYSTASYQGYDDFPFTAEHQFVIIKSIIVN